MFQLPTTCFIVQTDFTFTSSTFIWSNFHLTKNSYSSQGFYIPVVGLLRAGLTIFANVAIATGPTLLEARGSLC